MKYVKKQLTDMGVVTKEMTIDKWIEGNPEEWEKLINEEYEKRNK